ncbi:serine/threonine protein kinase [Seongchinamella sediminis]|uniref:non-specific serine/threonine protein kinase n=1 Tax=Seongchinamella sediminis TaxID=2283635 RepID=A0A3L7DXT0_9GAMM|nr:serine/threonine-protein kinase [Seongchinamella sediminis]RLQ22398.1 serine/threonine protein kinase [Seongchinamella sediminis]
MAELELPGYELYERLGRGGMATVYRALHLNLDREVAIKVMDPGMNADESFSERFIREARISARLTHPHILQIYDVNTFDGYNYIAMELLGAGELSDFINLAMPQKQIYTIVRQVAEALDYAAGRGYVHRDIKPSNIMLRDADHFVLADFGIARAANSGTQMTQTGLMVGTPSYMSPEQAKGQEVDGRSDLYALAVLVYEMLTKTLPYESDSAVTTAVKHLTEDIPTLPEHLAAYQEFINKGLAKSPDDRFQTGAELYQAFMAASAGFDDDEVLTAGVEKPASAFTGTGADAPDRTSLAGDESTRLSHASSPSVSTSSRPYKLEGSTQRERLVSGTYARSDRAAARSGGFAFRILAVLAVLAGAGYGGYSWWQGQQNLAAEQAQRVELEKTRLAEELAQERARITALLEKADAAAVAIAADPANAALAVGIYQSVKAQDPDNQRAAEGLAEVAAFFAGVARDAAGRGDFGGARQALATAATLLPGTEELARLEEQLPALEERWAAQQAELAARRVAEKAAIDQAGKAALDQAEKAALAQAEKTVAGAERSLAGGSLALAQQAYDEVRQTHPDLAAVQALGDNLRRAYGAAAREDIDLQEFDSAENHVALGASHFPDDPAWQLLAEEIETARSSSRRRLGAY